VDIKPHKVAGWIHTPIEDKARFNEQVSEICDTYREAKALHEKGVHVISCDEKTGIQALEREITPMRAGQYERQDNSYERHGTQCLIANFEVATGKIISPTIGKTRTEKDFVEHIERTIATDPAGEWIFVMDNLNTHCSESLVKLVVDQCGLDVGDQLGKKGDSGILKNVSSRTEFLKNKKNRIHFVYTPKHASWLNQIEIWFSILVKRLLKRLSVTSTEALRNKILSFIEFFNKTMAKPFKWTYNGKVLSA